jgi:hypothetical protein
MKFSALLNCRARTTSLIDLSFMPVVKIARHSAKILLLAVAKSLNVCIGINLRKP